MQGRVYQVGEKYVFYLILGLFSRRHIYNIFHANCPNSSVSEDRRTCPECAFAQADQDLVCPDMHGGIFAWHETIMFLCSITKTHLFKYEYIENFTSKNWKFSDIFHVTALNIDCGYLLEQPRRGGSNEYPRSIFLSRNKKNNVYPCKPQFYYIKNWV